MTRSILAAAVTLGLLTSAAAAQPAKAPRNKRELGEEYRHFLTRGRTPKELIEFALAHSQYRRIDPAEGKVEKVHPGDRLVFVNQDRTALFVVVGKEPLAQVGAHLVASHIDTPSPRLLLAGLSQSGQLTLSAGAHGGIKGAHWMRRPLSIFGQVVTREGKAVEVELGSAGSDDFSFYIESRADGQYKVIASSSPNQGATAGPGRSFVGLLHQRYGLRARDLESSELYLVPKLGARYVGFDKKLIGSHGQDDRANSYAAWRSITNLRGTPRRTSMAWLVDREESGSFGRTGARSHFLELVYAYLLRAQGGAVGEDDLLRALAKSDAISADTPACVNPNWPEVHEAKHGPLLGRGPALFPFTGHGGKVGGSQAHPELIRRVMNIFSKAHAPLQPAELGRVDEGGGGTVAQYLGDRGIDVVDIGVCVVGMHSPFELSAVDDFWWTVRGLVAWFESP
jgi:aspartyl aminopeptidase